MRFRWVSFPFLTYLQAERIWIHETSCISILPFAGIFHTTFPPELLSACATEGWIDTNKIPCHTGSFHLIRKDNSSHPECRCRCVAEDLIRNTLGLRYLCLSDSFTCWRWLQVGAFILFRRFDLVWLHPSSSSYRSRGFNCLWHLRDILSAHWRSWRRWLSQAEDKEIVEILFLERQLWNDFLHFVPQST